MVTETPLRHDQYVVFQPVRCKGTLGNGKPCNAIVFKGELREVTHPQAAVIEDKCDRCGRVAMFG